MGGHVIWGLAVVIRKASSSNFNPLQNHSKILFQCVCEEAMDEILTTFMFMLEVYNTSFSNILLRLLIDGVTCLKINFLLCLWIALPLSESGTIWWISPTFLWWTHLDCSPLALGPIDPVVYLIWLWGFTREKRKRSAAQRSRFPPYTSAATA